MQKYELNGETYYYKNGKWLDSGFLAVPSELCRKLNKLKVDEISPQSVEDLFTYLYQSNEANNTQLKEKVITRILEKAESDNSLRYVLPRLSSFYRQTGKSFKSIQYKKTGATTASITIKDMYVQFNWKSGTGVAYDTEYISLVFNSSTQGVSSGYWERRNVSGETGSSSGDIDASQFTLF